MFAMTSLSVNPAEPMVRLPLSPEPDAPEPDGPEPLEPPLLPPHAARPTATTADSAVRDRARNDPVDRSIGRIATPPSVSRAGRHACRAGHDGPRGSRSSKYPVTTGAQRRSSTD